MQKLVQDMRTEGDAIYALLQELEEGDWAKQTPFKAWTVRDVVQHMHWFDRQAVSSLSTPEKFMEDAKAMGQSGQDLKTYTNEQLGGVTGQALLKLWREYYTEMCDLFERAEAKQRCKWYGPDMGARMFATARLMESWAHAHDVYDLVGKKRTYTDAIEHIAVIGVKTFGWTFLNRGLEVPKDVPHVLLTAPSGAIWEWNEPQPNNRVEGLASEFCHVVTQGRNVADTSLEVVGETANRWMAIAQCFAGGPVDPPKPGERV